MNDDRIGDVYDGEHGSLETQRIARTRVHWMCRQVLGERIIDIGCSQGVVSLLLGREGKRVVGVDREAAAITEAMRRLDKEEEPVKKRVRFIEAEAPGLPFADGDFDTVILGEVIEHMVDPRPLLAEARRLLRPRGALVLTTPYGLFPYPDHKEPIYLADVLELLTPGFRIESMQLIHQYLAVVASQAAKSAAIPAELWRQALRLAEARLAAQDLAVERHHQTVIRLRREVQHRSAAAEAPPAPAAPAESPASPAEALAAPAESPASSPEAPPGLEAPAEDLAVNQTAQAMLERLDRLQAGRRESASAFSQAVEDQNALRERLGALEDRSRRLHRA